MIIQNPKWQKQLTEVMLDTETPFYRCAEIQEVGTKFSRWKNKIITLYHTRGILACSCETFIRNGWCSCMSQARHNGKFPPVSKYVCHDDDLMGDIDVYVPIFQPKLNPDVEGLGFHSAWAPVVLSPATDTADFYECVVWDNDLAPSSRHSLGLCTSNDTIPHISKLLTFFLKNPGHPGLCRDKVHYDSGSRWVSQHDSEWGITDIEMPVTLGVPPEDTILDRLFVMLYSRCMKCFFRDLEENDVPF